MTFGFNLHSTVLLGYFGFVVLVYFSTWRENGGVQTMPFLHGDFKILENFGGE